ncbi:MAG: ABC transporter permease [Rhodocyclaceae bacterium]
MSYLPRLAWLSAWNRRGTLALIVGAVAVSTALLLGVERIRHDLRAGFAQSVSGTDLIVGARGSPLELLLYAVFHLGGATRNIGWDSVQRLAADPRVAWTLPLSLGDSHRGYPVLATPLPDYLTHFRYGAGRSLRLVQGQAGAGVFDAVIGAEVARALGYGVGDRMVLAHGAGLQNLPQHADKPFVVRGILAATGTPVDRTVHINLAGMEAIHLDWQAGLPLPGVHIPASAVNKFDLTPTSVTAVLVGLKLRGRVFAVQRDVNDDPHEPLMAILPGVALDSLWSVVGVGARALMAISALVALVGLAGLCAVILAGLGERRRELAILRSVGAHPREIAALLLCEGACVMLLGIGAGVLLLAAAVHGAGPALTTWTGVTLEAYWPAANEWTLLGAMLGAGVLASAWPAWRAYRLSLMDGLTPNV